MDLKRIFRGWTFAILAVVVVFLFVYRFSTSGTTYKQVDTSYIVKLISKDQVKSALLVDTNQTIEVITGTGKALEASWVGNQGQQLAQTLQSAYDAGKLPQGYNVEVPKGSSIWSLLLSWLPFVAIFLLFFVFMNQMQGGGSRVMNFGKSRAKLVTKDLRRRGRRR